MIIGFPPDLFMHYNRNRIQIFECSAILTFLVMTLDPPFCFFISSFCFCISFFLSNLKFSTQTERCTNHVCRAHYIWVKKQHVISTSESFRYLTLPFPPSQRETLLLRLKPQVCFACFWTSYNRNHRMHSCVSAFSPSMLCCVSLRFTHVQLWWDALSTPLMMDTWVVASSGHHEQCYHEHSCRCLLVHMFTHLCGYIPLENRTAEPQGLRIYSLSRSCPTGVHVEVKSTTCFYYRHASRFHERLAELFLLA